MLFNKTFIKGYGVNLPDSYFTSDDVEEKLSSVYEKLRLPYGRLEMQTGIKQRGYWGPGTLPSDIAVVAGENAIKNCGIDRKEIQVLIHASVCRDFLEPATASVVHHKLGLRDDCTIFDLSNACLGVMNSFVVIANMIEMGQIDCGMVVSGENSGPLLLKTIEFLLKDESLTRKSIKKYFANLTIGSAGVAFILTSDKLAKNGHRLLGGSIMSDTKASTLCQGDGNSNELMMETDSEALMHVGVGLAKGNWQKLKGELGWNNQTPNRLIGHQVGIAHRSLMLSSLELDDKLDYSTFDMLGNTGSAALPVSLALAADDNFISRGDLVALLGIGSGLNTIMLGVEW